jgi:hypothetical protein
MRAAVARGEMLLCMHWSAQERMLERFGAAAFGESPGPML